jgi:hypothetical protein
MTTLEKAQYYKEYLDYVIEHVENVQKAWDILKNALKHENVIYDDYIYWTIDGMIKEHDMSKLSSEEFTQYADYFYSPYGSKKDSFNHTEEWKEKEHLRIITDFEKSWKHHLENNDHHWENWSKKDGPNYIVCCIVCMVADWMAMGMKFGDTAEEYYRNNYKKIDIPDWSRDYLEEIFKSLRNYESKKKTS